MKSYIYTILTSFCCFTIALAQTKSQNYIKSTIYTQATTKQDNTIGKTKSQVVYYDGIGRPIQEIAIGISPNQKSVIKHIEYDLSVGKTKDYLNYSISTNSPDFNNNAKTEILKYYKTSEYDNTENPYSEILYEKSALKRIEKTASPGNDWNINTNNVVQFKYRFNRDNEVKYLYSYANYNSSLECFDPIIRSINSYSKNSLYVTEMVDENGNIVEEFKNEKELIVLKRVHNQKQMAKLFNTSNKQTNNNLTPSGQELISDELKGKSIQDVVDNFGTIVNNVENNVNKEIDKANDNFKDTPNKISKNTLSSQGTSEVLDTYYIYDQYDNLVAVTSPLAEGNFDNKSLDDLGYQYKYDKKNRLVAKKLPSKAWEYMVYDKGDRLVASGPVFDPLGSEKQGWLITKYDAFSRVAYTAFYSDILVTAGDRKSLSDNVNANNTLFEKKSSSNTIDNTTVFYTNNVFPKSNLTLLTVNYYDNYIFPDAPVKLPENIEGQLVIKNVNGLLTGQWNRVFATLNGRKSNLNYMFYDYNSRILRSYTKNYLDSETTKDTKYTFTGLPVKIITTHKRDTNATPVKIEEVYTYDHAERLLYKTHNVNNSIPVVLSENVYDELGMLQKKNVGGKLSGATSNSFLQQIQYKYNIRGWLTAINDVDNLNKDGKNSLFALKLNYNKLTESTFSDVKSMFNGNISEQIWKTTIDNKKRSYSYTYDGVNRLTAGLFISPDLNVNSSDTPYSEKLSYDKNGNITGLNRNGAPLAGVVTASDKLLYGYEPGTNKLSSVKDLSGNQDGFKQVNTSGVDYTYDVFGNLISDKHKKISKIKYNHLNLPIEINFGSDKIEYTYSSVGEKLQKKVTEKGKITQTDYLSGFQYIDGELSFFPTSEGFFNVEKNAYVYQFKDHLGNVRLSYTDKNKNNIVDVDEIIEETNYYPFGLAHKGYNQKNDALMKDYKYQYNGKENQEELGLNLYDYGARNYDAAIGRWMNIDPLAEQATDWTPYNYTFNNPIRFIDPDGMWAEDHDNDNDGWIVNKKTGEKTFSPHYDGTNTPAGHYYGDALIEPETIYNADGTTQSIDPNSRGCIECHHDFVFGVDDNKDLTGNLGGYKIWGYGTSEYGSREINGIHKSVKLDDMNIIIGAGGASSSNLNAFSKLFSFLQKNIGGLIGGVNLGGNIGDRINNSNKVTFYRGAHDSVPTLLNDSQNEMLNNYNSNRGDQFRDSIKKNILDYTSYKNYGQK